MGQTSPAGGPALGNLGVIVIGGGVPRVWAPIILSKAGGKKHSST